MQFRIVRAGMTLGLALGFLLPALAASAEFKLAVVDQRRALLSSNGGKAAESTLTQLEEKKKELEPRSARCKKMQEEIEKLKARIEKRRSMKTQLVQKRLGELSGDTETWDW